MASRMLQKSASIVLASLRGSTRVFRSSDVLEGRCRSPRSIVRANGPTKCGPYLLAPSLAAALPDGLFEHPDIFVAVAPPVISTVFYVYVEFFRSLLGVTSVLPLSFPRSPGIKKTQRRTDDAYPCQGRRFCVQPPGKSGIDHGSDKVEIPRSLEFFFRR